MTLTAAAHPDSIATSPRTDGPFVCLECGGHFSPTTNARVPLCPLDRSPLISTEELSSGDPLIGRKIDSRFTILSLLGSGSMGSVYRAVQSPIGREVAIKILRSDRALDEASRGRFLREARANSLLTSPNTVTMFDFGESGAGEFYLVMELLMGESLGQRLKRVKRLEPEAAISMARQALQSLVEAHAKGIIHRDLKPDNLFFAQSVVGGEPIETVKVVDFGVAKMLRGDDTSPFDAVETQAGTVFGTPRYMSPEQAQGKPLDARSDLYSLGVILYHALTGRPPFTDDDAVVVMARHIKTAPKPLREACPEAGIPAQLDSLVMRCLAKEPSTRARSAEALTAELDRALDDLRRHESGPRLSSSRPAAPPSASGEQAVREPSFTEAVPQGASRKRLALVLVASAAVALGAAWLAAPHSSSSTTGTRERPHAERAARLPETASAPRDRTPVAPLEPQAKADESPSKAEPVSPSSLPKAVPVPPPAVQAHPNRPASPHKDPTPAPSSTGYTRFEL